MPVPEGRPIGATVAAPLRRICRPHRPPVAADTRKRRAASLRDRGCRVLYLPPYLPDLNPIEQAFSRRKAHLGRIGARPLPTVFQAIGKIRDLYEPIERSNDFKAHSYVSN